MAAGSIGIGAAPVQAKDDAAKRVYLRCAEFEEYPEESRTLYLPIETVVAAFGYGAEACIQLSGIEKRMRFKKTYAQSPP